jgi:hypothetical protein
MGSEVVPALPGTLPAKGSSAPPALGLLRARRPGGYHCRNDLVAIGLNPGSMRKLKWDTA